MKHYIRFSRFLLWHLLLLLILVPGLSSRAEEHEPAPLPSSGLPSLEDYESGTYSRSYGVLPSSYDSRTKGFVTSVKDQNPWGTCWAFSAMAAGESSILKKGAASSVDLSELHFSYFFFYGQNDPLGNTSKDTVSLPSGADNYLTSGGNNLFTMFTLSKWIGPASESLAPYSAAQHSVPTFSQSLAYQDAYHMQNARLVSTADLDSVKKLIMEYGAVSTAIYYNSNYLSSSNSYYCPKVAASNNHIVTLVGWDDNYATYHFSGTQPSSPGAWIAKNSYGSSWGNGGYFYISYEDKTLCSRNDSLSYAFDMEPADNYDYNYQYDGSSGASTFHLTNGNALSNIYTVSGNTGGREKLKAVSFSLYTTNVSYSIQVYRNPDPGEPESGTPLLPAPQTGTTTYCGYYTIPLNTQPVLQEGDTFSVVITLNAQDQSYVNVFVDYTVNTAGIQFTSSTSAGQSFFRSGGEWYDFYQKYSSATARIKAFTCKTSEPVSSVISGSVSSSVTLPAPRIKTAKSIAYNQLTLTWTSSKGASGYKIYRSTSANGSYVRLLNTKRLTYTDTKRKTGTTYYYKIRAYKVVNGITIHSPYSNTVKVKVIPAKTSITKITKTDTGKLKLTWKRISGANGYSIYRSTSKNSGYKRIKIIKSGKTTSYITAMPPEGKRYYYRIRAYRLVNGKRVAGDYSQAKGYTNK